MSPDFDNSIKQCCIRSITSESRMNRYSERDDIPLLALRLLILEYRDTIISYPESLAQQGLLESMVNPYVCMIVAKDWVL